MIPLSVSGTVHDISNALSVTPRVNIKFPTAVGAKQRKNNKMDNKDY